ncbi:hypothetical protein ME7_00743 [Bartonella birtlesii LL-WM9]|uniref:Uncharacterized protein n=1 Tax=Bartonella birtlesii LL-WM9 TaxID=1094552 RepID=J0YQJ7_9HYPH|nr:hypothetical protein ME7_00743 [Bartonella birtlesii LL-WM9]
MSQKLELRYLRFAGSNIRTILKIVLPETYKNYESYKTEGNDEEKCCKRGHVFTCDVLFCFTGTSFLRQTASRIYE